MYYVMYYACITPPSSRTVSVICDTLYYKCITLSRFCPGIFLESFCNTRRNTFRNTVMCAPVSAHLRPTSASYTAHETARSKPPAHRSKPPAPKRRRPAPNSRHPLQAFMKYITIIQYSPIVFRPTFRVSVVSSKLPWFACGSWQSARCFGSYIYPPCQSRRLPTAHRIRRQCLSFHPR